MSDKDLLRNNRAALEQALKEAGAQIRGRTVLCPFHQDRRPSGSLYEKEGIWRFKCMACGAGGDVYDIRALANGTTVADELRSESGPKLSKHKQPKRSAPSFANLDAVREFLRSKVGPIESEYRYTSAEGDTVQTVFRCKATEGKTFRPVHLSDAGYVLGAAEKPWPLYNLPAIAKAEAVVVVEGEKCADILNKYGFCATTSAGGAKNARSTDWTPLAGKRVILWPDNDTEGRRYIVEVESILQGL
jgi:hypothetical protein